MRNLPDARIFIYIKSGDDVFNHVTVHVGQAEVAALITIGEPPVINAELV